MNRHNKNNNNVYWVCDVKKCPGTGRSDGFKPPFLIANAHIGHNPRPEKLKSLLTSNLIKTKASSCRDNPRSIIIEANKFNTAEEAVAGKSQSAQRYFI